jgi:serine O-acetyltransferase
MDAVNALQPEPDAARLWSDLRNEALAVLEDEPGLATALHRSIVDHDGLEPALAHRLAHKLACADMAVGQLRPLLLDTMLSHPGIGAAAWADLMAVTRRDPACTTMLAPLLHFSGFLALQAHRVAHRLWGAGRKHMALHLQSRCSQVFGVDIHPAARIGKNVLIDHAISVVIGETAVVEDDVSMLHEVTLGGRGEALGDRHPKVRRGATLGAGAKVLGNIELGAYCRIGAGSVVLDDVPPFCTVVGIPARIVCQPVRHKDALLVAPAA